MIILPGKPGGWGCSHISVLSPDGEDYNHGIQWKWDKIWHFNVKQNVCEPLSLTMITNLTLSTGESPDGGCQNVPANLHANPHFVSSVMQQNLIKFAYFNIFTAEGSYFIHDLFDFGVTQSCQNKTKSSKFTRSGLIRFICSDGNWYVVWSSVSAGVGPASEWERWSWVLKSRLGAVVK